MTVIGRERMLQYSESDSGHVADDLQYYVVDDFQGIIARTDSPMTELIGSKTTEHNRIVYRQGETDLPPRVVKVDGQVLAASNTLVLDANHTNRLQVNDQIYIGSTGEVVRVTGITDTETCTIDRSRGTVAAANIPDDEVLKVIGPATPEGSSAVLSPTSTGFTTTNYMQIFEYTFQLSHRARVTKNYEFMNDRFRMELKRLMTQATIDWGLTALFGVANAGDGGSQGADDASSTGGLIETTTTHREDFSTGNLTFTGIMNRYETMFEDVGARKIGKTVVGNLNAKRIWNSLFNTLDRDRSSSQKSAGPIWDVYETDVGEFKFRLMEDMPDGKIISFDPKDCTPLHYTGGKWATGVYATDGWFEHGFLRGDFGFKWDNDRYRAMFYNFETDVTQYSGMDIPN